MTPSLSVVVPVHDEAPHLPGTIDALADAVERSGLDAEVVVVDDGSTDGSAAAAEDAVRGRLPVRVLRQANEGRFAARRTGVHAAAGETVLLLDARVRLRPDALAFVHGRLDAGERVWNGHVEVAADRNPYGAFGKVLVALAWRDYFAEPRSTSFDADSFDRYPKGTTCFLAPRALLLEAIEAFNTRYADLRHANDDTPVLRHLAARGPIHISPEFACDYTPRGTLRAFVRHSLHRGVVFLDGHGRRESRFFPVVVAFYPVSAVLALAALRRPLLVPALAAAGAVAAGAAAAAARRPAFECASFAALTPVYALAHGAGMWRGLGMLALRRLRRP